MGSEMCIRDSLIRWQNQEQDCMATAISQREGEVNRIYFNRCVSAFHAHHLPALLPFPPFPPRPQPPPASNKTASFPMQSNIMSGTLTEATGLQLLPLPLASHVTCGRQSEPHGFAVRKPKPTALSRRETWCGTRCGTRNVWFWVDRIQLQHWSTDCDYGARAQHKCVRDLPAVSTVRVSPLSAHGPAAMPAGVTGHSGAPSLIRCCCRQRQITAPH